MAEILCFSEASVDLEGYQRAWRLRHGTADDELMRQAYGFVLMEWLRWRLKSHRQVFGQELEELQKQRGSKEFF